MDTDLSKTILLDALKSEQTQCLKFIAEARRNPQIREGVMLHWAMTESVAVYRELRDGKIDIRAAALRYDEVARITHAYDTAMYMAFEFVPFVPTTAAQIALRDNLLGITRKDAA